MVRVQDHEFPEDLFYDIENQVWYAPLAEGTLRAGFTSWAAALMGEILVFTPKRIGHAFEKNRWFAWWEAGNGLAPPVPLSRGVVTAHNNALERKPQLLNQDPFGRWLDVDRAPGGQQLD